MGFSSLDWPADCQLFPPHEEVLKYIETYADDVRHLIQFDTRVVDVQRHSNQKWTVSTQPATGQGQTQIDTFDAVIVANGHFDVPFIPCVPGIEEWSLAYLDSVLHSKFYRIPERFTGKKVIVVGNSASGVDIGAQIAAFCKLPLIVSQRSESFLQPDASPDVLNKPEIAEFIVKNRSVRFVDGTVETEVDFVVYCTGYFYSFPFLRSLSPPLVTSGERVNGLYQHIFHQQHPSLAFLVLNQKVIPFPLAEAQSAVIAAVFAGHLDLPGRAEMEEWEKEILERTGGGRGFHVLKFPQDADYINMLHDWSANSRQSLDERESASSGCADSRTTELPTKTAAVRQMAPYWGKKEYWMRERFPAIKKAFQSFGTERHTKRTLEDVGFDYEEWARGHGQGNVT